MRGRHEAKSGSRRVQCEIATVSAVPNTPEAEPDLIARGLESLSGQIQVLLERTNDRHAWPVAPGSALSGDDEASAPFHVSHAVRHSVATAVEHNHAALLFLVREDLSHPAAPFALARAAIEAAAQTLWLLDPETQTDRVRRRLGIEKANIEDSVAAAAAFGAPLPRSREERIKSLREVARSAGIGPKAKLGAPNITEIIKLADRRDPQRRLLACWKLCSGFAHGRLWASFSASHREELSSTEPDVLDVRITRADPVLMYVLLAAHSATRDAVRKFDAAAVTQPSRPTA